MGTLSHVGAPPADAGRSGLWSWITTVDHKRIGILYLVTGMLVLMVGGLEALMFRTQLAGPELKIIGPDLFNRLVTMHGLTMVFGGVMPITSGFMNYLLPLQIGARDVAFPRLNALSYWIYLFAAVFLYTSWFLGGAPAQGWFAYTSLSTSQFAVDQGMDFYVLAAILLGISSLVAAVNFIVTIFNLRTKGMTLFRMPVFVWATLFTSILLAISLPPFTVDLILLLFDRWFGTVFFDPAAGANQLLWQHLFWIFGHPEVYIMIIPTFGIVTEIIPVFSGKPLFGYLQAVGAMMVLVVLSYMVWSHHMFTTGMGPVVNSFFTLATMSISIPTGILIFNWLGTMWGGKIRFTAAMLFAVGFLAQFTIGGLTGVMLAAGPSDYQLHDTYFVIAHFHYVLVGGALFALFGGAYYWMPKMFGRLLNERLGRWNFWLAFVGFNATFMPLHFAGLYGLPRRVYTYSAGLGLGPWNLASTIGAYLLGVAVLVFLYNVFVTFRQPKAAIDSDPWDARTLEWSTPTPVPEHNFTHLPEARGLDAWWVMKESGAASARSTGRRQIHMPSPSCWPFILALCLITGSYGMVFKAYVVASVGYLAVVVAIFAMALESTAGYHIEVEEGRR